MDREWLYRELKYNIEVIKNYGLFLKIKQALLNNAALFTLKSRLTKGKTQGAFCKNMRIIKIYETLFEKFDNTFVDYNSHVLVTMHEIISKTCLNYFNVECYKIIKTKRKNKSCKTLQHHNKIY